MLGRRTAVEPAPWRVHKRIEIERMADKKRPRSPEQTPENRRLTRRTFVFKGLAAAGFAALTARLYQLQVRDRSTWVAKQEEYNERYFVLNQARGMLFDRDHTLIADNVKSWAVAIVPISLPPDDTDEGVAERNAIYTTLANHLKMPDILVISTDELPRTDGDEPLRDEIYNRLAAALNLTLDQIKDPVERELAKADAQNVAAQAMIKIPPGDVDLSPEQLAVARSLENQLFGVHVVNPVAYQVDTFGFYDQYNPLTIKTGVEKDVAMGIEANRLYFPGVQIVADALSRRYHVGEEIGHLLGYTGPITKEEWDQNVQRDERGDPIIDPTNNETIPIYGLRDSIGKAGIEAGLEPILRGKRGKYVAKINAAGKIVGDYPGTRVEPVDGNSVVLTIPLDYQKEVIAILQRQIDAVQPYLEQQNETYRQDGRFDKVKPFPIKAGAAVALDPRNGEVLALGSIPSYDPNLFSEGITQAQFDVLLEKGVPEKEQRHPLINRAISYEVPPGSTMKTFIASGGLQGGAIQPDTKFKCMGHIEIEHTWSYDRDKYWCWTRDESHQELDVREALATSCDVFFYNVGGPRQQDEAGEWTHYYQPGSPDKLWLNGLGIDRINEFLRAFGYGEKTGIELPEDVEGVVPGTDWKEKNFPGEYWSIGDTIVTAIGQGYDLVTPLQLCNATAAIANRGTLYKPTLVHEILDGQGNVVRGPQASVIRKLPIAPEHLDMVREGMRMNVYWWRDNSVKGLVAPTIDAQNQAIPGTELFPLPAGIDAGVKTGTAEYGTEVDDDGLLLRAHAWTAAFAPYNNPEICVVAFVEGGSASATIAAPVANGMINAWFARKQPKPGA
jgi:penicillin-binding protein 2